MTTKTCETCKAWQGLVADGYSRCCMFPTHEEKHKDHSCMQHIPMEAEGKDTFCTICVAEEPCPKHTVGHASHSQEIGKPDMPHPIEAFALPDNAHLPPEVKLKLAEEQIAALEEKVIEIRHDGDELYHRLKLSLVGIERAEKQLDNGESPVPVSNVSALAFRKKMEIAKLELIKTAQAIRDPGIGWTPQNTKLDSYTLLESKFAAAVDAMKLAVGVALTPFWFKSHEQRIVKLLEREDQIKHILSEAIEPIQPISTQSECFDQVQSPSSRSEDEPRQ